MVDTRDDMLYGFRRTAGSDICSLFTRHVTFSGKDGIMNKEERIKHANEVYCRECEKNGISVCSWEDQPAYASFVSGEIDEKQLFEMARQEMASFAQTFHQKAAVAEELLSGKNAPEREKARIANKIYKQACSESGKDFCFFNNFLTWQEFVHGEIEGDEFYRRAVEEVRKMADAPEN